jgi:hypothetical protein
LSLAYYFIVEGLNKLIAFLVKFIILWSYKICSTILEALYIMRLKNLILSVLLLAFATFALAATPTQQSNTNTHSQDTNQDTNLFPHRSVVTSPIIDIGFSSYGGDDLLVNTSTMNEDLLLLKQIQTAENKLKKQGIALAFHRPVVELSGKVESQLILGNGFSGASSDVNLSAAELDIHAIASKWASAFMTINYDSSPPETGNRESNSRLYLQRGFLTLGNLNTLPVYLTVGQMYVPFGAFSSDMVTTPLTTSLARIQTRAGVLGFSQGNFFAQAFGFRGDAYTGTDPMILDTYGGNAGLSGSIGTISTYQFGVSYVSNIANSQGMQDTGLGGNAENGNRFSGFSTNGSQQLQKRVPATDVNGKFSVGRLTLIGEYIYSTRKFNVVDLSFNGQGAQPRVMHVEVNYDQPIHNKVVTFGAAYGQTWDALALNLPKQSYSVFATTSLIKNTIEGIEFRHDVNYASTDVAGGNNATTDIGVTGRTRNLVTTQIGVYF